MKLLAWGKRICGKWTYSNKVLDETIRIAYLEDEMNYQKEQLRTAKYNYKRALAKYSNKFRNN